MPKRKQDLLSSPLPFSPENSKFKIENPNDVSIIGEPSNSQKTNSSSVTINHLCKSTSRLISSKSTNLQLENQSSNKNLVNSGTHLPNSMSAKNLATGRKNLCSQPLLASGVTLRNKLNLNNSNTSHLQNYANNHQSSSSKRRKSVLPNLESADDTSAAIEFKRHNTLINFDSSSIATSVQH